MKKNRVSTSFKIDKTVLSAFRRISRRKHRTMRAMIEKLMIDLILEELKKK